MPAPEDPSFFVSLTAQAPDLRRRLPDVPGPGRCRRRWPGRPAPAAAARAPTHSFAVRTLLRWYRTEGNIQAKIPSLSTYMGHREPACTYWYLSAAPELLALAAARRDDARKAARS